jgi:hypothetical protein
MSEPIATGRLRRLFRPTPFRLGLLAGVATFGAIGWLFSATMNEVERGRGAEMDHNVEIVSSGDAMTRHGARRLEIQAGKSIRIRQVCNEACDDLSFTDFNDGRATYGASYGVSVLTATGDCLSCKTQVIVSDLQKVIGRIDISNLDPDWVRGGHFEIQPDGSRKLYRPAPPVD